MINITDSGGTIEVQVTSFYNYNNVTISPSTYYFNKGDTSVEAQGISVIMRDASKLFSFLYSDITTPSGGSAASVAASIQAFI